MSKHSQETKIAILEAKVEHMMGHVKELTHRVRANEKVVAIVSAVGIGAGGIVGTTAFAPKADAAPSASEWVQELRNWESEKNRVPVEESINNSLAVLEHGCNDSPKQEILLQFSGDENQKSFRWRYDRCGDRSRIRFSEDGESEDCWSGHTRKEDTGLGGEGTWVRCNELDEGQAQRDDKG